jgi:hypothetical protein
VVVAAATDLHPVTRLHETTADRLHATAHHMTVTLKAYVLFQLASCLVDLGLNGTFGLF